MTANPAPISSVRTDSIPFANQGQKSLKNTNLLQKIRDCVSRIFYTIIRYTGFYVVELPEYREASASNETILKNRACVIDHQAIAKEKLATDDTNWGMQDLFGHMYVLSGNNIGEGRLKVFDEERQKVGLPEIVPGGTSSPDKKIEHFKAVMGREQDKSLWGRVLCWGEKTDIPEGMKIDGILGKINVLIHQVKQSIKWLIGRPDETQKNKHVKGQQGRLGCFMSHLRIIEDANAKFETAEAELKRLENEEPNAADKIQKAKAALREYSSILIFEDNNGFGRLTGPKSADTNGTRAKFLQAMTELPKDWDMVYFQTLTIPPRNPLMHLFTRLINLLPRKHVSQNLTRLQYGLVSKSYAISAKMYKPLIMHLNGALNGSGNIVPVDNRMAELHFARKCYAASQSPCYRISGGSTCGSANEDVHYQPDPN